VTLATVDGVILSRGYGGGEENPIDRDRPLTVFIRYPSATTPTRAHLFVLFVLLYVQTIVGAHRIIQCTMYGV